MLIFEKITKLLFLSSFNIQMKYSKSFKESIIHFLALLRSMVLPFCYLYECPSSEVFSLNHLWDKFGQQTPWYHKSNQGRKRL